MLQVGYCSDTQPASKDSNPSENTMPEFPFPNGGTYIQICAPYKEIWNLPVFVYSFSFLLQIQPFSFSNPNYRTYHIFLDRYLQDEYDCGEIMEIGWQVAEKSFNYFPPLGKVLCPLFYEKYPGSLLVHGMFSLVYESFGAVQVQIGCRRSGLISGISRVS